MNNKIVSICALTLGLAGCGGGGGGSTSAPQATPVDSNNVNIDYPIDYGATLFPDPTEAHTQLTIDMVTGDASENQKHLIERYIFLRNTDKPFSKSEANQIISTAFTPAPYADKTTAINAHKALFLVEFGLAQSCVKRTTGNTMPNPSTINCSIKLNGDDINIVLTYIKNRVVKLTNGSLLEEALYKTHVDTSHPNVEFPTLEIGMHQGFGITSAEWLAYFVSDSYYTKTTSTWQTNNIDLL